MSPRRPSRRTPIAARSLRVAACTSFETYRLEVGAGIIFMDVLKQLFEQHFHTPVDKAEPLHGHLGGSARNIVRLAGEKFSAIGVRYEVREENVAFLEFSRHFRRHGLPVPEIYAEDLSHGAYLEEDLGDTTLFEFLSKN